MGDRVGGAAFCGRRHGKNLVFCQALCCFNMLHVEDAFRQRTCFIEYNRIDLGQGFQIVAPFHEDTVFGSGADAAKERQGDGNDEGAGAGNDEEHEGTIEPFGPGSLEEKGRDDA